MSLLRYYIKMLISIRSNLELINLNFRLYLINIINRGELNECMGKG
jgi:hypothetical protein